MMTNEKRTDAERQKECRERRKLGLCVLPVIVPEAETRAILERRGTLDPDADRQDLARALSECWSEVIDRMM